MVKGDSPTENEKPAEPKPIKKIKGIAYIVRETEDHPGGSCESKKCPLSNPSIINGMIMVKAAGKQFHGNCAIYENIDFVVPSVPKVQKEAD